MAEAEPVFRDECTTLAMLELWWQLSRLQSEGHCPGGGQQVMLHKEFLALKNLGENYHIINTFL